LAAFLLLKGLVAWVIRTPVVDVLDVLVDVYLEPVIDTFVAFIHGI
jgi:hypothetical protein